MPQPPTKKETVFSGPVKQETVYSGPSTSTTKKETVFNPGVSPTGKSASAPMVKETVFGGPTETVYSGPSPAGNHSNGTLGGGTLYDPTKVRAKRPDTSVARAATQSAIRRASMRFFIVALIQTLAAVAFWDSPPYGYVEAFVAVTFCIIGVFAFKMNRGAFMAGIIIYGIETLYLVTLFFGDHYVSFVRLGIAVFVKCSILVKLYRSYGLLSDLQDLEAS